MFEDKASCGCLSAGEGFVPVGLSWTLDNSSDFDFFPILFPCWSPLTAPADVSRRRNRRGTNKAKFAGITENKRNSNFCAALLRMT